MKTEIVVCCLATLLLAASSSAKIALIGNKHLSHAAKRAIVTYGEDIELLQGKSVYVDTATWDELSSAAALRSKLLTLYKDKYDPIEGAILIGDLPVVQFEMKNYYGAAFPCDRYFMDLDGHWLDTAQNGAWDWYEDEYGHMTGGLTGVFDGIREAPKDQKIEIWVSRIVPSAVAFYQPDQESLIIDYLARARNRMAGGTEPMYTPRRFLAIYEDQWWPGDGSYEATALGYGTNYDLLLRNHDADNTANIGKHLVGPYATNQGGYEFCYIQQFGNWSHFETFSDENYRNLRTTAGSASNCRFYLLEGNSSCRWTNADPYTQPNRDCIGALLALTDQGLIAVGSTKSIVPYNTLDMDRFLSALRSDSSFGAAYKSQFQPTGGFDMKNLGGFVILGAGNLLLNPQPAIKCLVKQAEINKPGKKGSFAFIPDETNHNLNPAYQTFIVNGCGANIYGRADQFRYVYHNLNGDGTVQVKLSSMTNTSSNAKAGIMIRESLLPNSKHATLVNSPGKRLQFLRRTSTGGTTSATTKYSWVYSDMKLVRTGNRITASAYDVANSRWVTLGSPIISMKKNIYIGIAVASGTTSSLCNAVFTNVWYPAQLVAFRDYFEGMPPYQVVLGGNTDFKVYNDRMISSGVIGNNQESRLRVIWDGEGVQLGYGIDSEEHYDFFKILLDGREVFQASGYIPWDSWGGGRSYQGNYDVPWTANYNPPDGIYKTTRSLELIYAKDGSTLQGQDRCVISNFGVW